LAAQTSLQVVADHDGTFGSDGVFNAFAKCIDVAVDSVTAHGNSIVWWITVIDWEIWLKDANLF
jgi:hypothetical protein